MACYGLVGVSTYTYTSERGKQQTVTNKQHQQTRNKKGFCFE